MYFCKILIFYLNTFFIVSSVKLSSKLRSQLQNQEANSAFLKKNADVEIVYFGKDPSLQWRFEKMAKWYNYKTFHLGFDANSVEVKLTNYLQTIPSETVVLLLNSDSAWINKGPKQLLKYLSKQNDYSGIISNNPHKQETYGANMV